MSFPRSSLTAALLLLLAITGVSVKAQSSQDSYGISEGEQELFTKGQALYVNGLYGEAISTLDELLSKYPSSTIKDLALLWLGRSYLAQGDIANAEKVEVRLKDVPESPLLGIYEDELRAGRQNFARAATGRPTVTQADVSKPASTEVVAPVALEQPALKLPTVSAPSVEPTTKPANKLTPPTVAASQPVAPAQVATTPPVVTPTEASKPTVTAPAPVAKVPPQPALKLPAVSAPPVEPITKPVVKPTLSAVPAVQPPVRAQLAQTSSLQSKLEEEKNASGEVAYRLLLINDGTIRAADLTIRIELQTTLTYVSSDLMPIRQELISGRSILTFKIPAVEAGQSQTLQISTRPRAQASVVTKTTYSVFYKDNLGQFHHTP